MAARLWHKAPFIRLLTALATGIVVQWHAQLPLKVLFISLGACTALLLLYTFTPIQLRYRLRHAGGALLLLLVAVTGSFAVWLNDTRNNPAWFGHPYKTGDFITVTVEEPLVEKANSYKALATVTAVYKRITKQPAQGTLILYFKKDSLLPPLQYGSRLLLSRSLQEIKNAGNPGSFDYKTYSLFQGITHQVFLTAQDYVLLPGQDRSWLHTFLFNSRKWVVATLQRFISGEKEQGLAEALLIGYKDDLDRNLVQAYSNTGVVHIIAISGLHLGLIYWLLLLLTKPLNKTGKLRWLRFLLIVASLWLFSLLAGAGPSVLRSALMFSLIALGEVATKRTNILNTLAFSAFVLLCINPFWLWDVGFQLSYAAVLSIVLFFQPVYHWFSLSNKAMDFLWKLTAVTIAAQILTLPISIYHFHQMPLLFLVANFVAVPLSSLVLMGEILLCAVSAIPFVASFIGAVLRYLIGLMNNYVESLDRLPFATWNFLSINLPQAILLLLFALTFCYWLLEKQRRFAWLAFASLTAFMLMRGLFFFEAFRQKKLIVYNVPKHPAVDIIHGRSYAFLGDSVLLQDGFERNFHLQPSRILHRVKPEPTDLSRKQFTLQGKQVLLLSEALPFAQATPKQKIDLLVLSKNPRLTISRLLQSFTIEQVVVDGSVPPWRAAAWKSRSARGLF